MSHYNDKLYASRAYHALLKGVPKPQFLGVATNSWYAADLVAWQQRDADYGPEGIMLVDAITWEGAKAEELEVLRRPSRTSRRTSHEH